jgi:replication initiation and membrane attachment protein DnaB
MVTRGHRTLGRTIRKLSNSAEFSDKENFAKNLERKQKQRLQTCEENSPIQDLRKIAQTKTTQTDKPNL